MSKQLISRKTARTAVNAAIALSLLGAISGVWDCWRNPQEVSAAQLEQVQLAYEGKAEMPVRSRLPALGSMLKLGLCVMALVPLALLEAELSAYERNLAKPSKQQGERLAERFIPADEWGDEDRAKATEPKHKKPEFVQPHNEAVEEIVGFLNENPWIKKGLKAKAIVCVGKGGSGKSRFAMCMALFQRFFHAKTGADLIILDPQKEANQQYGTWISGKLYDEGQILSTYDEVLREKASARWLSTIFDEFSGWSESGLLKSYAQAAVDHAVRYTRKTNQSHIFMVHGTEKGMFGGEDQESGRVKSLLDSSMVIHFVGEEDEFGAPVKAQVVWVKTPSERFYPMVDEHANANKGWERFNLPEKLDPEYFETQLGGYIKKMGWELKDVDTKTLKAIDHDRMMSLFSEISSDDQPKQNSQNGNGKGVTISTK